MKTLISQDVKIIAGILANMRKPVVEEEIAEEVVVAEEEQLDELKKSTLGSYVKKAAGSLHSHAFKTGKHNERAIAKLNSDGPDTGAEDGNKAQKHNIKTAQRRAGIERAVTKLAKEETEVVLEAEGKDADILPGTIKAVPGKGLWKARNRRGKARVFKSSPLASQFAKEETEGDYHGCFLEGLDHFNVEGIAELDESQIQEFFTFVDNKFHAGE